MRSRRYRPATWSGEQWAALTRRHPVGSAVDGVVTDVFAGDRSYGVRFGDVRTVVEYEGTPPAKGEAGTYVFVRLLEWTRRILIAPAG